MLSDLKYILRSLLRTPGFAAVAIITLALGIGATMAIFSMINTVLLQPLPYAQPERLARIYSEFPTLGEGGIERFSASEAEYFDIKRETKSWESVEAWNTVGANIAAKNEPTRITASFVTGGLLNSLGAKAALGRILTPQDDLPGVAPVTVISQGLWQTAFGGEPSIVGREVLLNGRKTTVVGVMGKSFQFPVGEANNSDVWTPLQMNPARPMNDSHSVLILGRLKAGVGLHQARSELDSLVAQWARNSSGHHLDPKEHPLAVYDLHDEVVRTIRPALQMLFGAVCFLLLIAAVNVANLLLARAEARQREIAIRGALGAGIGRLASQFIAEGLALSGAGAGIGLLLAYASLQFVKTANIADIPRVAELAIDGRVLGFALALSLLAGIVFGLAPLLHVLNRDLHTVMKAGSSATTDTANTQRFRQALIVGQLALALMLLAGTGLMLRAFWKLQQVDAGLNSHHVMTMSVSLPVSVYSGEAPRDFWTNLQSRLAAIPGAQNVTLATSLPPALSGFGWGMEIEGFIAEGNAIPTVPSPSGARIPLADYLQTVTTGYFDTLGIRLIAGRLFDERDAAGATPALIVNQTFARLAWGNGNALGRRIRPGGATQWFTVVGVVADSKNGGMEKPVGTGAYIHYTQVHYTGFMNQTQIAIRSDMAPSAIVGAVRRAVNAIDPSLPLAQIRSMEDLLADAQTKPRFIALLLTLFATVALVLAAVGIYGVISYSVARRTKEFGLRMALGAQPGNVMRLVLRGGLLLTVCGLSIGLVGAFASTRLLSSLLFGVTATDPTTFIAASLLLAAIALFATYIPARRATQVDPLLALRAE